MERNQTTDVGFTGDVVYDDNGSKMFVRANADNYPKLYKAVVEECEFRGIPLVPCYIDLTGNTRLGRALSAIHSFLVEENAYNLFSKEELRALAAHEIKHLYQKSPYNEEESRLNEYDCDRSAVESTSYKTIQSYTHKAASMLILDKLPKPIAKLAHVFHKTFPNFVAENCWVMLLDKWHPSPAHRMKAMREHEKTLHRQEL